MAARTSKTSSSTTVHNLTLDASTRHEERNPSTVQDNKRPPTPEKDRRTYHIFIRRVGYLDPVDTSKGSSVAQAVNPDKGDKGKDNNEYISH